MAKKKYYGVRKGYNPGIYSTWLETEAQVKGFPGAQYKGFQCREDAVEWLAGNDTIQRVKKNTNDPPSVKANTTTIYTDGGALGNPGPGGYGVILLWNKQQRELSGGFRHTTNNRMELMACIKALQAIEDRNKKVELFSDSSYVVNSISKGWARKWRSKGWLKSDGKPAVNSDLWEILIDLCDELTVQFHWVKGHAGNRYNERCDRLAVAAAKGTRLEIDEAYEEQL